MFRDIKFFNSKVNLRYSACVYLSPEYLDDDINAYDIL